MKSACSSLLRFWLLGLVVAACSCEEEPLNKQDNSKVEITSPAVDASLSGGFEFSAKGTSNELVVKLQLFLGSSTEPVQTCTGDKTKLLECSKSLVYADYGSFLENGSLLLRAEGAFGNGKTKTAKLLVGAGCSTSADCGEGYGCCMKNGKGNCYPAVGPDLPCDCEHPCQKGYGCFPGTCGAPPRLCRPNCGMGRPYVDATDSGELPETCPDQLLKVDGAEKRVPAYCSALPESEVSDPAKPGACAPAFGCSIADQLCPDGLLFPDQEPSESNPMTAYNCVPATRNDNGDVTTCYPAGPKREGEVCERRVCGASISNACAKGLLCTKSGGESDYTCKKQCLTPRSLEEINFDPDKASGSDGCPTGTACGILFPSAGDAPYATGVCAPLIENKGAQ